MARRRSDELVRHPDHSILFLAYGSDPEYFAAALTRWNLNKDRPRIALGVSQARTRCRSSSRAFHRLAAARARPVQAPGAVSSFARFD
jgi:hypothetical protein